MTRRIRLLLALYAVLVASVAVWRYPADVPIPTPVGIPIVIPNVVLNDIPIATPVGIPIYIPNGSGKIVFAFDGHIWTVNADGYNLKQLPANTWEGLAVSPDGKQIAFGRTCFDTPSGVSTSPASATASAASPDPNEAPCISVMNTDGSDQRTLLDLPTAQPVWSPDSKQLAFIKAVGTGCHIYAMNADGSGSPTRLTTQPTTCGMDISTWSPDGKKMSGALRGQIYVIDVSGRGENQPLKLTEGPESNNSPQWSPNGTEIAFTHSTTREVCVGADTNYSEKYCYTRARPSEIYKMNTDGSDVTRLTYSPDLDFAPRWSPDGRQIAFVRQYAAGRSAIYTMNSDGSNLTLVRKFEATNTVNALDW